MSKIRVAFVIGQYPPEQRKLREDTALRYSSEEVEVGILSVPASPYDGLTPAEIQLAAPYFHAAFIEAQEKGFDAVVPLGMLDLGVDGGRSLVDIPVIGPLEAVYHVAAQLGDRFGIICYHPYTVPRQMTMTRMYGMESWIAGRRTSGYKLNQIASNKDQMVENFIAAARALIDQDGADVIIPHGITQCPVQIDPLWLQKELGVPVVEGIGAPIRMAAMMVKLGLRHSRKRWPKSNARPKI